MTLYTLQIEKFDGYETPDDEYNEQMENWYFLIEGYSLSSNLGFYKSEKGIGISETDAIFDAYEKIKNRLAIRYHITVSELMVVNYKQLTKNDEMNNSGFSFYPLDYDTIEKFSEDEERYLMSCEDIKN